LTKTPGSDKIKGILEKPYNMPEDKFFNEFPSVEEEPFITGARPVHSEIRTEVASGADTSDRSRLLILWEGLSRAGLAEKTLRIGTLVLLIALILLVAWGMRQIYLYVQVERFPESPSSLPRCPHLPRHRSPELPLRNRVERYCRDPSAGSCCIPLSLPGRTDVITYTVQVHDTIFGIAEEFGLKPKPSCGVITTRSRITLQLEP
jgi:hypothetical protein